MGKSVAIVARGKVYNKVKTSKSRKHKKTGRLKHKMDTKRHDMKNEKLDNNNKAMLNVLVKQSASNDTIKDFTCAFVITCVLRHEPVFLSKLWKQ